MSENHDVHFEVLTNAEREALEQPGLKQRAKALIAATEFTTKLGLSEDAHSALLDRLRGLDKGNAKLAWETLGDMNELLTMLEIDMSVGSEGEIELRTSETTEAAEHDEEAVQSEMVPAAETSEPQIVEVEPVAEPIPVEPVKPVEAPVVDQPSIAEALDSLIELESHGSSYKLERVESVLEKLRRGGVELTHTADDFSHEVLKQLALIYSEATRADPSTVRTNIACTWGWLYGIEMNELVDWRRSTKPDAKAVDVHNSRAMFMDGVIKGWKQGLRPQFGADEDMHEALHLVKDEVEEKPVMSPEVVEEPDEVDTVERPIEEEPRHVQVVDAYVEKLGLTVNKRAFEELLNPKARGDDTPAKAIVIEVLRQRVGQVSAQGQVLNELPVSARSKSALRRMLGIGFVKHGKPEEHTPEMLRDQLRNVAPYDQNGYAEDLYKALDALLDVLEAPEVETPKEPTAPLQVVFDGDEARLA